MTWQNWPQQQGKTASAFTEVVVENDRLRTKLARAQDRLDDIRTLIDDAHMSGRTTVLIENLNQILDAR